MFSVYLVVAFLIGSWLVSSFRLTDPSLIILFVLVLSISFSPLHSRLMRWLEEKIYPEKTHYRIAIKEKFQQLSGFIEESQLLENISNWLSETMSIHPIYAVSIGAPGGGNIPLKPDSSKSVLEKVKDGSNFLG